MVNALECLGQVHQGHRWLYLASLRQPRASSRPRRCAVYCGPARRKKHRGLAASSSHGRWAGAASSRGAEALGRVRSAAASFGLDVKRLHVRLLIWLGLVLMSIQRLARRLASGPSRCPVQLASCPPRQPPGKKWALSKRTDRFWKTPKN